MPILHEFKAWMDSELKAGHILPKSEIRKAFTYTLNQWDALCCYTQEGFLSYDNNAAERFMKRIAVGKKNWLFVGSLRAGLRNANLMSLVGQRASP